MKITFISPILNMGGGIKVISIYAQALIDMGHDVIVVSPPEKKRSFREKLVSVIKGKGFSSRKPRCIYFDDLSVHNHILDTYRPVVNADVPDGDIVIATWWETAEWVNKLDDNKGAKVYFIQGHEVYSHLPVQRCKDTYRLPFYKIIISNWLKNIMINEYNDLTVDLVPNSIDPEQFFAPLRTKQSQPTVGFLFNTSSCKGLDITLKVINKLRSKYVNLNVISFGSNLPVVGEIDRDIDFHHLPKQSKIRELYAQCDVWLTSSRLEGFNLTAMEAMACRTPVVSTKVGWPEESIITDYNGVLADVDDIDALAMGVESILSLSASDWEIMSEKAYVTVASSSWANSAKLFEKSLFYACSRSKKNEIAGTCDANIFS